ncbi:MAG TPA: hypothetical protein VND65_08235 [Candidatus Binatia bacterium]|nr:hypothetical protein [Candidatus Binatia bacterium]
MVNDDLAKCPLCGGFTHIDDAELLSALRDPRLRKRVENFVEELLGKGELAPTGSGGTVGRDFHRDVHSWNPYVPIWRRSPKE